MVKKHELTIISGAQTGVDRAALDAALMLGVPCGGWCPEGRKAEDGIIPQRYPVEELIGAGYKKRTRQNVIDSDVTIIIYFEMIVPKGGTEQTISECEKAEKKHLLIDGSDVSVEQAAINIQQFINTHNAKRINFAGPRGRNLPQAYEYTRKVVEQFLRTID